MQSNEFGAPRVVKFLQPVRENKPPEIVTWIGDDTSKQAVAIGHMVPAVFAVSYPWR
jgi:hypothetical protein